MNFLCFLFFFFSFYLLGKVIEGCDESQQSDLRILQHKSSKYNPTLDDVSSELFVQSNEECENISSQITTFLQMTQSTSEKDHSDLSFPDGKPRPRNAKGLNQLEQAM